MRRRLKLVHLAPILAIITLLAWVFASPIGASPDDDYHLVSTWCATEGELCQSGESERSRVVPEALVQLHCYAADSTASAGCQAALDLGADSTTETRRGNFRGEYPPVFYAVMHLFAGPDIISSALVMRAVSVLLFVALTTSLFLLLPVERRATLVWAFLITTMPMGVFLLASNNPSGWAVMGLGTSWLALLGYLETSGRRKAGLGVVFALSMIIAAGARGDAAMYAVVGVGAVFLLTVPWGKAQWSRETIRRYALDAILPIAMVLVSLLLFLGSGQTESGIDGFSGPTLGEPGAGEEPAPQLSGFALLAYNLLNIPFLLLGNFGEWGLGWLDTSMPAVVSFATMGAFIAAGFTGLSRMWPRKALVVGLVAVVLWLLPTWVLQRGGHMIETGVQPRYLLPLIVLFAGLLLLSKPGSAIGMNSVQRTAIVAALSVANFVALHINIRRYVTGVDAQALSLDAGVEWWWPGAILSPNLVWIAGSLAFAVLVWILVREISRPQPGAPQVQSGLASRA